MDQQTLRRQALIDAIEQRVSANHYDPAASLSDAELARLVELATRAPTAFNLQNWRFIAVRSAEAKERLWEAAYRQPKVKEAAATFIICGQLPDATTLAERLQPSVDAGFMPGEMVTRWVDGAAGFYGDHPRNQRDEAVRSATFGAATLMFAAEAHGLVTGPMVGFDPAAVARGFGLGADEIPVLLLTVGPAAPGNWPQKPRRPLADVLELA